MNLAGQMAVVASWIAFCLAGTWIRVGAEERLLSGTFGTEFEAYRRRVPALLPLPRRSQG